MLENISEPIRGRSIGSASDAINQFEHLRRALFWGPSELVAALTAYLDESGTHAGARAVAIGCYVASVERWKRFTVEWLRILERNDVEPPFHMVDFAQSTKQFAPWKGDEDRRLRLIRPLTALCRKLPWVCGRVIEAEPFRTHIASFWEDCRGVPLDPYLFGIRLACEWMVDRLSKVTEPIQIIIEDGHEKCGTAIDQFHHDKALMPERWAVLGGIAPGSKARVTPLQAADVLAYESYKVGASSLWAEDDPFPIRGSFLSLLDEKKKPVKIYGRANLRAMAIDLRAGYQSASIPGREYSLRYLHPDVYERPKRG